MRSVPRNIDRKGEHLSRCDACGVMYLRSALRRGRDGQLRCENDLPGRDELELAELTASRAASLSRLLGARPIADGAAPDTDSNGQPNSSSSYTRAARRTTVDDVYDDAVPTYLNPGTRNNLPGF
jgi:hypothetical protein